MFPGTNRTCRPAGHGGLCHADVMIWKCFPHYWSFVRGIYCFPEMFRSQGLHFHMCKNLFRLEPYPILISDWKEQWTPLNCVTLSITPDSKVHGANIGPTWVLSAPDVPHVGPMNLAIRDITDWPWKGIRTMYKWLSTRMQYLQCVSNGDTAVLN